MVYPSLRNLCHTDNSHSNPRIYVACLAAYTAGYLHGQWIRAAQSVDEIYQEVHQMLAKSPIPNAEEWAIHATDGFEPSSISEYACLQEVQEKAVFIQEHGELGAMLLGYHYDKVEEAIEALQDHYHGEHKSERDFAIYLFDEIYLESFPEHLRNYIDYDAFCRDIFIESYFSLDLNGYVHVFEYY